MANPQDTPHSKKTGFWTYVSYFLGIIFCLTFTSLAVALLYGGIVIRSGGDTAPAKVEEVAAAAVTPAPASSTTTDAAVPAPAPEAVEILIKPASDNPLMFETKQFTVKSGQKVKVTFENKAPIPQPHNWILGKPDTKNELMQAANAVIATGAATGYVPDIPAVISSIPLLQPGQTGSVEFVAGEPGDYPYICTFPGHAIMMHGVMTVE